jgi:hypothetical protein
MLRFPGRSLGTKTLFGVAGLAVVLGIASGFAYAAHTGQHGSMPLPVHSLQGPAGQRITRPPSTSVTAPTAQQLQAAKDGTTAQGMRGAPLGPIAHDGVGPSGPEVTINRSTSIGAGK